MLVSYHCLILNQVSFLAVSVWIGNLYEMVDGEYLQLRQ